MKKPKSSDLYSQLALPFQETELKFLDETLNVLEDNFGLKRGSKQRFIDLGAGNGVVVMHISLTYNVKTTGIEINLSLIQEAKEKIKKNNLKKVKILHKDMYTVNLKKYSYIYLFALPTMHKFLNHTFRTAKVDTIFIAHKYPITEFDSYLKLEEKISHSNDITTFIYRKIN